MLKRLSVIILVLALVVAAGCSSGGNTTATPTQAANVDVIKQAEISAHWTVNQIRITLESGIPILLTLAPGDTVDGYYFLEKGTDIDFQISGKSVIYQSTPQTAGSSNITSDRFSFTASDAQGLAYTLKFTPVVKKDGKQTTPVVFLELIYPKTGGIFNPMGTK